MTSVPSNQALPLLESILRLAGTEKFYKGAVSSEHPRCSEIGVEIMTQGGSAMDGAIASLLCLGVINNFATGIGGYVVSQ